MLGYWPGSAVHQRATLAHPRFEDFDYASFDGENELDILSWMGNGMIEAQLLETGTTGYLDTVDIPPIPSERQQVLMPPPHLQAAKTSMVAKGSEEKVVVTAIEIVQ